MIDFLKKVFGKENSSATAKERLKLVLLSDHISLAPEVIDRMKADLIAVIARYVEIDQSGADVMFEHRDREIAMLANVPILGLRDRGTPPPPSPGSFEPRSVPPTTPALRPQADAAVAAAPESAQPKRAKDAAAAPTRRRRRRKGYPAQKKAAAQA